MCVSVSLSPVCLLCVFSREPTRRRRSHVIIVLVGVVVLWRRDVVVVGRDARVAAVVEKVVEGRSEARFVEGVVALAHPGIGGRGLGRRLSGAAVAVDVEAARGAAGVAGVVVRVAVIGVVARGRSATATTAAATEHRQTRRVQCDARVAHHHRVIVVRIQLVLEHQVLTRR